MSFAEGTDQAAGLPGLPAEPTPAAPRSGLFGNVQPKDLSLATAIEVAFKALARPAFIGPILLISVLINAVLEITIGPAIRSVSPTRPLTVEDLNAILGPAAVSLAASLIGGVLVALYGQVWAVTASVGPFPTIGETLQLVGRRWLGVLGASLLVTLITLAAVFAGVLVLGILAGISQAIAFGVAVGLMIAFIWFILRLSMTPWLAADGVGVLASVQESWRITEGNLLRILAWSIAYGLLFALLAAAAGAVLGALPLVGAGIAQGLSLALTYAAGVTLYRRTQASSAPPAMAPDPSAATNTGIG